MAGNTGTDFNYLEFFKEEIRNENATIKIGAVNNLHLIASALGPNRTVAELIPYVVQVVQEEPLCNDDEFLYSMARQYAVLSDYINGHDDLLIAPLEHLAAKRRRSSETRLSNPCARSLKRGLRWRRSIWCQLFIVWPRRPTSSLLVCLPARFFPLPTVM